ncbi:transcriptional regulator [Haloterrigena sp. SYSU A558-1]|uniref:Transcriptional regulator n=1 Tax=Haloterrigena gelatinilytica TaxID=2741724 RepID=A0A8J8KF57_9EURY|nr:transcriptional regulator [Haloterrigena gelatinilytica]NUB90702.1 transcriptional regulator [Haloterrigena gelatinilytica]NUC73480.1 transcriptional regulator [Haloterrigena gelatinilytica]
MAIPTWTWTERAREGALAVAGADEQTDDRETATDPSRTADEFELLANSIRLEILLALADRETPLRYTDLRAATSTDDNGTLNYHLRRLEPYVSGGDGNGSSGNDGAGGDGGASNDGGAGYELTPRGRRLLDRLSLS